MAYHLIEKKRGNGTNLGKTFSITNSGRFTFTREMVQEVGFREGDTIRYGYDDSTTPATLFFVKVDKESGKGHVFHAAYGKFSAIMSAKQILDVAKPGRYQFRGRDGEFILTDCPVKV